MKLKNRATIRFTDEELQMLRQIIYKDKECKYDSLSHILRVGIVLVHRRDVKNEKKD